MTADEEADRNCISYWLPRLESAGLPVPRTAIVHAPDLTYLLDADVRLTPEQQDAEGDFFDALEEAASLVAPEPGAAFFLRTGHGAGKHSWDRTCRVRCLDAIPEHVAALVEWSETACFMGALPYRVWAVREMLPTTPLMHCPRYGNMPVTREWRCFVRGAEVCCVHPYWPRRALEEGFPEKLTGYRKSEHDADFLLAARGSCLSRSGAGGEEEVLEEVYARDLPADFDRLYAALCELTPQGEREVRALASRAGAALGGAWSVDVLESERGYFVTDVALAHESYHWEGCDRANEFTRKEG